MLDFRVYDTSFTSSEVSALHSDGPSSASASNPFAAITSPLNINVSFEAVTGAVAYKLTVQAAGQTTARTVKEGFSELSVDVNSLLPDTEYTVRLYTTTDGTEYALHVESLATTQSNVAANYDVSIFSTGEADAYDISSLNKDSAESLQSVLNGLFTTGDSIVVTLPSGATTTATFIERGASLSVVDTDTVLLPFDPNAGTLQSATLTLTDKSSVALAFDEVNDTIDIGGQVYSPGESFILDGMKVTVVSI